MSLLNKAATSSVDEEEVVNHGASEQVWVMESESRSLCQHKKERYWEFQEDCRLLCLESSNSSTKGRNDRFHYFLLVTFIFLSKTNATYVLENLGKSHPKKIRIIIENLAKVWSSFLFVFYVPSFLSFPILSLDPLCFDTFTLKSRGLWHYFSGVNLSAKMCKSNKRLTHAWKSWELSKLPPIRSLSFLYALFIRFPCLPFTINPYSFHPN